MSANHQLRFAADYLQQRALAIGYRLLTGEQRETNLFGELATQSALYRGKVLRCQNLGWGNQRRLPARVSHGKHGANRNQGLTRTNFTLQKTIHRMLGAQIFENLLPDLNLTSRQLEGQCSVEGL